MLILRERRDMVDRRLRFCQFVEGIEGLFVDVCCFACCLSIFIVSITGTTLGNDVSAGDVDTLGSGGV